MENKKIRIPNYTADEKSLFLILVAKIKNIVENMKADHVNCKKNK